MNSGFIFSLRESFSSGDTSPGIMFQFYLTTDGSLKYLHAPGGGNELPVQTDLALDTWHDIELNFDTQANECTILVNGANKGTVGYYGNENIINYFHILSGSVGSTGTDIYIDEMMIQDTSVDMPTGS